jgi:hypothetical protein
VSLNLVKCISPLEAEKGSGRATGTKVDLLLASWRTGLSHYSSLGDLGTSARSIRDRTSRTRPAPTIRAAAALQRSCAFTLARIGIFCTSPCTPSSLDLGFVCFCFTTLVSSHFQSTTARPLRLLSFAYQRFCSEPR